MSHALQARTASRIEELFALSAEQAQAEASGLLDAIDSHSGDSTDWFVVEELIERQLGARLPWRSQSDKAVSEKCRSDGVAGYSEYLNKTRGPLERKW
jgi:hypothetical protein